METTKAFGALPMTATDVSGLKFHVEFSEAKATIQDREFDLTVIDQIGGRLYFDDVVICGITYSGVIRMYYTLDPFGVIGDFQGMHVTLTGGDLTISGLEMSLGDGPVEELNFDDVLEKLDQIPKLLAELDEL